jgi:hypothetical protein
MAPVAAHVFHIGLIDGGGRDQRSEGRLLKLGWESGAGSPPARRHGESSLSGQRAIDPTRWH